MRTNKESQTRHVCVEWFLESIKAVVGLESLFHIIIQCRTGWCSTTSLIMTLRLMNALEAMSIQNIFHYTVVVFNAKPRTVMY